MSPHRTRRRIPDATVSRLPIYLQILTAQLEAGVSNMSSEDLAGLAGVNAAKVRKDLSYLGSYGTRGVGYEVQYLVYQIRHELGLEHDWHVVIVGAGNLGQALAGYGGFADRGYPVAGIVDVSPDKVDTVVGGVRVRPLEALDVTGTIRATQNIIAFYSSDEKLKDNITPIQNALEKVEKIGGYEFDWNEKQNDFIGHDIGLVAQEIEKVIPEVVTTRIDGYKAVRYDKLVALLIEAIKELSNKIKN